MCLVYLSSCFLRTNKFGQAKKRTVFFRLSKLICIFLQTTLLALYRKQNFWHPTFWNIYSLYHLRFCIDSVLKSVIFSLLYRFFIENRYRYIKLTAIVIFTAIFIAFSTSFGFVFRTQSYDYLVALFTLIFAFNTICSSGRFKIYQKIPFLFCFLW